MRNLAGIGNFTGPLMYVVITSLTLKNPWKFFALSRYALDITRQVRKTPCREFKKYGRWTKHYTMTLWESESELQDFARSGAHLESMKKSSQIAREIATLRYEADALPNWKDAISKLEKEGKKLSWDPK